MKKQNQDFDLKQLIMDGEKTPEDKEILRRFGMTRATMDSIIDGSTHLNMATVEGRKSLQATLSAYQTYLNDSKTGRQTSPTPATPSAPFSVKPEESLIGK